MRSARLLDTDSGEVIYAVVALPRKRHFGGFFVGFQEAFTHLAKLPLSGESRRVLEYLFGVLDFENYIRVSHGDIAADLGTARPSVSRAIAQLVANGVLIPGPAGRGQKATYRLDPNLGWRGREASRKRALRAIQGGIPG